MRGAMAGRSRSAARGASLAVLVLAALAVSGCQRKGEPLATGSIGTSAQPGSPEAWRSYAEEWGRRYDEKPGEKQASLNYARGLRALDQRQQAVAVLEAAAIKSPKDSEILAAYGKALVENGEPQRAQEVLARAHTPDRPDWRILSAQGVVADQLGDHAGAQSLYNAALKIVPDEPGVLANLGLSYALSKRLPEAEATLRRAAAQPGADPRVRQNLALVLGLEGKFAEAESIARHDLSPVDAGQSVATIRQIVGQSETRQKVAQTDTWARIRAADRKAAASGGTLPQDEAAPAEGGPLVPVDGAGQQAAE